MSDGCNVVPWKKLESEKKKKKEKKGKQSLSRNGEPRIFFTFDKAFPRNRVPRWIEF